MADAGAGASGRSRTTRAEPGPLAPVGRLLRRPSDLLLGMVAAVLGWPFTTGDPGSGFDPSNVYGLNQWFAGQVGGTHVLYTYGPFAVINFLTEFGRGVFVLQLVWALLLLGTFGVLLVRRLRRWTPWPVATVVAVLCIGTSVMSGLVEPAVSVALLLAAEQWEGRLARRPVAVALLLLGALLLVAKPTTGLAAVVAGLSVVCGGRSPLRGLRDGVGYLALTGVAFVGLWSLTGAGLDEIGSWAKGISQFSSGYDLESFELAPEQGEYWYAALLVLLTGVLVAGRRPGAGLAGRPVMGATVALAVYSSFRHGFERHDLHSLAFFSSMAAFAVAVVDLPSLRPRFAGVPAVLVTASVLLALVTNYPARTSLSDPGSGPAGLVGELHAAVSGSRFDASVSASKAALAADLPLDPAFRAAIGDEPVDLEPYHAVYARAYGLHYVPIPTLQTETAFTPWLDRKNADWVDSAQATPWLLWRLDAPAIDDRFSLADSGAYELRVLCRYRDVGVSGGWRLLQRIPDRCGAAHPVGQPVTVRSGEVVDVPAPTDARSVVVATVTNDPGLWFDLRRDVFKTTTIPTMTLDSARYRYEWTMSGAPFAVTSPADTNGRPVTTHSMVFGRMPGPLTVSWTEFELGS